MPDAVPDPSSTLPKSDTQPWYLQPDPDDGSAPDPWRLVCPEPAPLRQSYLETVFTLANGYMGVRGYPELVAPGDGPWPRGREAYLAGVFDEVDDAASRIIGKFPWPVVEMVNLPDLFHTAIELDGETLDLGGARIVAGRRELDMRNGLLTRTLEIEHGRGRRTRLRFQRFLSAAVVQLAVQRVTVEPVNWSGSVAITHRLDGEVVTYFRCGNKREAETPQHHFVEVKAEATPMPGVGVVTARTRTTGVAIAISSTQPGGSVRVAGGAIEHRLEGAGAAGRPVVGERWVAVEHDGAARAIRGEDRDADDPEGAPGDEGASALPSAGEATHGFDAALAASEAVWRERWARADVTIEGDARDQLTLRFNIFQLLQMAPFHSDRLSLPARALSWNRYRGLYFWDTEIFLLPFYCWVLPEVARNLLAYRWHALDGARRNAEVWGGEGALIAWITDDTGRDNSIDARVWKLFHQVAAVAYAVDQYVTVTGDEAFMREMGLELLTETARFFASRFEPGDDGKLHLAETIGPDEDHSPGMDNGYTCMMARHNLRLAARWAEHADAATRARLNVTTEDVARWRDVADRVAVPEVPGQPGVPLQDQWFLGKKPADVAGWRLRDAPDCWRVPEGFKRDDFQIIKQADIVLGVYLLRDQYDPATMARAFDFYEPRTLHLSSLSWNTHAIVAARIGRLEQAAEYYHRSAGLDLDDLKQATDDGLHAAALGGAWQAVTQGFVGLEAGESGSQPPRVAPVLPKAWRAVRFRVSYRGRRYQVEATSDGATVEPLPVEA